MEPKQTRRLRMTFETEDGRGHDYLRRKGRMTASEWSR